MADIKLISSSSNYQVIESNSTPLPPEHALNFIGGNIVVVDNPGNGSTDVSVTTAGLVSWFTVTTNQALVAHTGYFNNAAGVITFTLPATAAVGDTYDVQCVGTAGMIIAQRAGQTIQFGEYTTTSGTGGSLSSTGTGSGAGTGVTIACYIANTGFTILPGGATGFITVT